MEKVAPRRSPMTVYRQSNNAWADDEAPAMFVPSLSVCLLACRPLTFFLPSFTLPPSSVPQPSHLPHSVPSLALSLSLFLFSADTYLALLPWSCAFYNHPHCSPQSGPIYSLHLPLRIFFSVSFHHSSSNLPPSTHTAASPHKHTAVSRTVVRFCLWHRKAISRLSRVVSSREMYRCQEHVLYVWALGWKHFGEQKISYHMTSSGIKVNYQL